VQKSESGRIIKELAGVDRVIFGSEMIAPAASLTDTDMFEIAPNPANKLLLE
jgi:hypothetical protein